MLLLWIIGYVRAGSEVPPVRAADSVIGCPRVLELGSFSIPFSVRFD